MLGDPPEPAPSLAIAIGPAEFLSLARAIGPDGGPAPLPDPPHPPSAVPPRTLRDALLGHPARRPIAR